MREMPIPWCFPYCFAGDILKIFKGSGNSNDLKPQILECEKTWVFATLMFVAGFYGAYTYTIRGGVFCNAQTANFIFMAMELAKGQLLGAFYYFIPMFAYLAGVIVSESIPSTIKKSGFIRWDTLLVFIEIIMVVIIGFLPETAPFQISQIAINVICAMQYNTFRQTNGIPMATTFCTNHLRQTGVAVVKVIKHKNDRNENIKVFLSHILMLFVFVCGGVVSAGFCYRISGKAIWIALIPLIVVFVRLLYVDIKNENNSLYKTPKGH